MVGEYRPTRENIMETSWIKEVVSSIRRKTGPMRCLSESHSVCNSTNKYHGGIELDSHSDTTILSINCVILTYRGKECDMLSYSKKYEYIQHIPVVTGVTAWTFPHSRETFILVFNKSLWMGKKLDHTLVIPNQIHQHRIDVQDNPCMHKPMGIAFLHDDVTIPLYMDDTIVFNDTSSPTQQHLGYCTQIILTSHFIVKKICHENGKSSFMFIMIQYFRFLHFVY